MPVLKIKDDNTHFIDFRIIYDLRILFLKGDPDMDSMT